MKNRYFLEQQQPRRNWGGCLFIVAIFAAFSTLLFIQIYIKKNADRHNEYQNRTQSAGAAAQ
jgi:hypothetical protein